MPLNVTKKFKKDSACAAEYKVSMDDVLSKGYADRVPQEQLQGNDDHIW